MICRYGWCTGVQWRYSGWHSDPFRLRACSVLCSRGQLHSSGRLPFPGLRGPLGVIVSKQNLARRQLGGLFIWEDSVKKKQNKKRIHKEIGEATVAVEMARDNPQRETRLCTATPTPL